MISSLRAKCCFPAGSLSRRGAADGRLDKIHQRHIRLERLRPSVFGNRMPRALLSAALWLALLAWAGGILWLSSLGPGELPSAAVLTWDKSNHFMAFALGGWLAASALRTSCPALRPAPALLLAVAAVAVFGVLDESRQLFTPGRNGADLHDWIADFLGATAGAILAAFTHARLERLVPRP